ncbi:MAG: hypothetical protein HOJ35_08435 [Bdellovibrionales bacterium]|nr:hypothetical protein [Bdellovibrionales bacterium]
MRRYFLLLMLLSLVSCSSTKEESELKEVEHENIQKDYIVRDASSNKRPGWIEDANLWAKEYGKDTSKTRYFSYETDLKSNRSIACSIAKSKAKADIAGEISTFIDQELKLSEDGDASIDENNPELKELHSYIENTLSSKVQSFLNGASILKTYWEKRKYLKEKGAAKDYTAYVCSAFVSISKDRLTNAINRAVKHVVSSVKEEKTKQQVKALLKNAADKFSQQ